MKRVLVVEEAEQARATAELVAGTDASVTIATGGERALDLLRAHRFDCLIVDVDFPDMSGEELLLRISASESFSFPRIIVHASRELRGEEDKRLLRYSHSIIVKGARSATQLLDEIALCQHRTEDETLLRLNTRRQLAYVQPVLEGRCVLLVDDDIRTVLSIASALEKYGARVEVARTGIAALKKLEDCPLIDLVLLDIVMPGGNTTLHEIRRQRHFEALPIIAMTHSMNDEQQRSLPMEFDSYVTKPIDVESLVPLIREWRSDNR